MKSRFSPNRTTELTLESIEIQGRHRLYQSLNFGRILVMTGSGFSRAEGMPDWAEFAILYTTITRKQIKTYYASDEFKLLSPGACQHLQKYVSCLLCAAYVTG